MQLNICKHCRKIFYSGMKTFTCEDCKKIDDELFDKIEKYLMEYPNSNAMQIAEGLEIQVYQVLQFIDEGRLIIVEGKWSKDK